MKRPTALLRRLRDFGPLNAAVRLPLKAGFRALGVPVPERLYRHLSFRGPFTVQTSKGRSFRMASHGHAVENSIYWAGLLGHEPDSMRVWCELAEKSRVILDIGANTGLFALVAATVAPSADVHAFEPVPRIHELLAQNCRMNPHLAITPHAMAVGDQEGEAELFDPGGDNAYSASLDDAFVRQRLHNITGSRYSVPVTTVDALWRARQWPSVDLVKLDVEGHEAAALAGMRDVLSRFRPKILLEFLPDAGQPLLAELERLLASGYELFHLDDSGPVKAQVISPSPKGMNVLLSPGSVA